MLTSAKRTHLAADPSATLLSADGSVPVRAPMDGIAVFALLPR